eukprot:tig00001071_g6798.t1
MEAAPAHGLPSPRLAPTSATKRPADVGADTLLLDKKPRVAETGVVWRPASAELGNELSEHTADEITEPGAPREAGIEDLPNDVLSLVLLQLRVKVKRPQDIAPLAALRLVCRRFEDAVAGLGGALGLVTEVEVRLQGGKGVFSSWLLERAPRLVSLESLHCTHSGAGSPSFEPLLRALPHPERLRSLSVGPHEEGEILAAARFPELRRLAVLRPHGALLGADVAPLVGRAVAALPRLELLLLAGARVDSWAALLPRAGAPRALALHACSAGAAGALALDLRGLGAAPGAACLEELRLEPGEAPLAAAGLAPLSALPALRSLALRLSSPGRRRRRPPGTCRGLRRWSSPWCGRGRARRGSRSGRRRPSPPSPRASVASTSPASAAPAPPPPPAPRSPPPRTSAPSALRPRRPRRPPRRPLPAPPCALRWESERNPFDAPQQRAAALAVLAARCLPLAPAAPPV